MKTKSAPKGEIDWSVAKKFPEAIYFESLGEDIIRTKIAVSKLNGETVAYYMLSERGVETTFLYVIRDGAPFMLEKYPTRPDAVSRMQGFVSRTRRF